MEYTANISSARNTQEGWDDIITDSDSDDNNNNNSVDGRKISDGLPKEVVKILVNTQKVQAVVHNEDPEPPNIPPHDGNGAEESGNTERQRAAPQLSAPVQDQLAASTGPQQVVPPFQAAVS